MSKKAVIGWSAQNIAIAILIIGALIALIAFMQHNTETAVAIKDNLFNKIGGMFG